MKVKLTRHLIPLTKLPLLLISFPVTTVAVKKKLEKKTNYKNIRSLSLF